MKPKHEIISGACFAPTPGPDLGCCGVLAVANFAEVPFADVFNFIKRLNPKRRANWTGATYDWERRKALEHFGVHWSVTDYKGNVSVGQFASHHAQLGRVYMVEVPRHVLVVRDEFVTDQGDDCHWSTHHNRRRRVGEVWLRTFKP